MILPNLQFFQIAVFWLEWVIAGSMGLLFGKILNDLPYTIYYSIYEPPPGGLLTIDELIKQSIIFGLTVGFSIGFAQWFVLKKWLPNFSKWIGISILGWCIGITISRLFFYFYADHFDLEGLASGLMIGVFEWMILRKYFKHSIWWILIWGFLGYLSWGFGVNQGYSIPLGDAIEGGLIGLFTGFYMIFLFNFPTDFVKS